MTESIKREIIGSNQKQAEFIYHNKVKECNKNIVKYKGTKNEAYWREERSYFVSKLQQIRTGCVYE